jgi:hypothetical protein
MELGFRVGQRLPELRLGSMGGSSVAIGDFAGRKVLVYLWASWDGSRDALGVLQEFHEKNPDLAIVSIACDAQGPDFPMRYLRRAGASFEMWIDATCTVSRRWKVKQAGVTLLLDENRCLMLAGERPNKALLAKAAKLAGKKVRLRRLPEPKVDTSDTRLEIFMQSCSNLLTRRRVDDAVGALKQAAAVDPENDLVPRQTWALKHPERFYEGNIDEPWLRQQPRLAP